MGKLRQILLMLVVLLFSGTCFAKQISFQIIQYDDRTEFVTEQSFVVEDELLNGFFETGYIVTNSPTVSSKKTESEVNIYNQAFGDAYEGSSDFFIEVKLFYEKNLNQIDWNIASVKSGKKLYESSITNLNNTFDEKGLKKASSKLIAEITQILRTTKA